MKKKIIALLSAAALVFSSLPQPAAAADSASSALRLNVLAAIGIMNGDSNGNLNLSANVSRAEFTKMIIAASPYKDVLPSSGTVSPYPDVPYSHWASGYINAAKSAGLVSGYLDGSFRPSGSVTLAEGATVVLKLLGYSAADFVGSYPTGQMSLYRTLKLDKNISAQADSPLTRNDCASLIYNALTAKIKTGGSYASSLGFSLDASGEVDYLSVVNSLIKGPIVADGSSIASAVGFTPAQVLRNDKQSSISEIRQNDVIYYLKQTKTVWAYSTRITGTVENILPDRNSPSSIVVAGTQYSIETSQLAFDFSSLGKYKSGDTVTLLLGRGGNSAAAVLDLTQSETETVYGIVTASGTKDYSDEDGRTYSGKYLQITATDGNSYQYSVSTDYLKAGDIVRITFPDGKARAERCSSKSLSGKVNSSADKLSSYSFADDIEIIDTIESSAVSIEPQRLKNVTIPSSGVRFYALNSDGQISCLILKNITGDVYDYGVLTSSTEGAYKYITSGAEQSFVSMTTSFSVHNGAFGVFTENGKPSKMFNLTAIRLDSASGTSAVSGNRSLPVSGKLRVFTYADGEYFATELARVSDSEKYSLTGYYDKEPADGGQIRVIIAKAK